MRKIWLPALVALAACSKGGAPVNNAAAGAAASNATAAAAPAPPSAKLAKIFTADVIGSNVAFLETITGPAFRTDGAERIYKVDGCEVIVGTSAGKIDNIGVQNYSDRCSFPIAQYFASGYDYAVPRTPTFGDLRKGLGGHFAADCLRLCGNAAAPQVSLSYQGSHADNFTNLYAAVPVTDEPVLTAYQTWADKLAAKVGDAALETGTAKLDDSMQDVADQAFGNIRPTVIRVGEKLPGED